MARPSVGVPPELARRSPSVFRPRDLSAIYVHPRGEISRLVRRGVVRRLATGYYTMVPQHRWGDATWFPAPHATALGIGQADYGTADVALMSVSAARVHGAIPRAVASAVVAVPKQRPALTGGGARLVFVRRDISRLDVERTTTELGDGWVTTVEQTMLDLAARPELGGLTRADIEEAIRALTARADWSLLRTLAEQQHRPAALETVRAFAESQDRA